MHCRLAPTAAYHQYEARAQIRTIIIVVTKSATLESLAQPELKITKK